MKIKAEQKQSNNKNKDLSPVRLRKFPHHASCSKAIIELFPDPLIVLDNQLNVHCANAAFCKIFKVKEAYDGHFYDFDNGRWNIPPIKKFLSALLSQKKASETAEITHTFPSLGEKTVLLRASRIIVPETQKELILLIVQDITKSKIIQTYKDDFVGYVTHELKTPITSLHIFLEILQGYHTKTQDKKSQFLLTKVEKQVSRLKTLLHSFSSVYKLQTNRLILSKERLNITQVVRETVETFQYTSDTHHISFEGNTNGWVFADKDKVHEVLANLITNAIKYSPEADRVIVSVTEDDKQIIVSVQDFGFGIPKDEQKKVFERFFRAQDKKQYNIKGVGLGLYIISRIIKQHKGKLWLKSKINQGTTVFFALPKEQTRHAVELKPSIRSALL